ncbi:hypothetical protein EPD83_019965, partial [Phycicoccus sp. CMS6Z-2]|nr:hypothetical protein [Phycicoccus flavus]
MRGRAGPEAVSARALARLRSGGADGWVPSRESLGLDEEGAGHDGARGPAGRRRRVPSDREGEGAPVGGGPPVGEARGAGGRGDARDAAGRHRPGMPGGGWLRLPAAFVGARWQPGRAAVAGVALVTVLAVLVLGLRVAWARESG